MHAPAVLRTERMSVIEPDRSRVTRVVRDPAAAFSHQQVSRRVRSGELERLRRGVVRAAPPPIALVAPAERYPELRRRYLDRVLAVAETRKRQVVFAGASAMAIWDMPVIEASPSEVELLEPPASARRSKRGVRVHRSTFDTGDIVAWGDHFVTSPARTIADLARRGDFTASVIALDYALSSRAAAAHRVTKSDVLAVLDRAGHLRGRARATRVLEFADARAGSAGESLSRVGIFRLGFEMPELQVRHHHPHGYYEVDFEWPARPQRARGIGEFDGRLKYLDVSYGDGRDAAEIVLAEKVREDFLRDEGSGFARWGWREARRPAKLLRPKLERLGLRVVRRPLI